MATPITAIQAKNLPSAISKPSLIAAYPTLLIGEALHLLATHRVTCLPLFSHGSTRIVSIVNLFDIMLYIIHNISADDLRAGKLPKLDEPVENVLGLDSEMESYRMHITDAEDPLKQTLVDFSKQTHRSLVVSYPLPASDKTPEPPWLLSQSDIIRYLHTYPEAFPATVDLNASIGDLGLVRGRKVVTAKVSETALTAFQRMAEKGVLGIAILNDDGNLVGNLSASNLRGITSETLGSLMLPVVDYLNALPATETHRVTATRDMTLRDLVKLIFETRVHRVWIIEGSENEKVIDVVSLSDLMGLLVKE